MLSLRCQGEVDIVGGGGDFFNSFAKSLQSAKPSRAVGKSPIVQDVLQRLLAGKAGAAEPAKPNGHAFQRPLTGRTIRPRAPGAHLP